MDNFYLDLAYLVSAICFIYGLKMLSHPKTARNGNMIATLGMLIAIVTTVLSGTMLNIKMIAIAMVVGSIIGAFFAIRVEMTQMPQLVAIFNGFGGGASALVASSEFIKNSDSLFMPGTEVSMLLLVSIILSLLIGTLTFTGSFIAFGKLQGLVTTKPVTFTGQQLFNTIIAVVILIASYF